MEKYADMLAEWNSSLAKNSSAIEFKFNKKLRMEFDRIHGNFNRHHNSLRDAIDHDGSKPENVNIEDLELLKINLTDFAVHDIEKFMEEMRNTIGKDRFF